MTTQQQIESALEQAKLAYAFVPNSYTYTAMSMLMGVSYPLDEREIVGRVLDYIEARQ